MACIGIGLLVLVLYYANSIYYVVTHENAYFDLLSIVYMALPIAVLVLDFIALSGHKWRNWSIASVGIKASILLIYLPQTIYAVSKMFEYGYRDYYFFFVLMVLFLVLVSCPSIYNIRSIGKDNESSKSSYSNLNSISVAGIAIGLAIAGLFLIGGVGSIGAEGYAKLGMIFIAPSLLAIAIILVDFLALKDKKWFAWSVVSLTAKSLCIVTILRCIGYELGQMLRGNSYYNLWFYIGMLVFIVLITYPSIRNIININKQKKDVHDEERIPRL